MYVDLESSESENEDAETAKQQSTEKSDASTSKQKKGILKNFKEDLKVWLKELALLYTQKKESTIVQLLHQLLHEIQAK